METYACQKQQHILMEQSACVVHSVLVSVAGLHPRNTDAQGVRVLISTRNPAVPRDDRHAVTKTLTLQSLRDASCRKPVWQAGVKKYDL